jgi:hypothetical protein
MTGITWLYWVPIAVFVALGALLVSTRWRRSAVNRKPVHCSSCQTPISLRRVPIFRSHVLVGKWVCPHCGSRMDSWGRSVSGTAT